MIVLEGGEVLTESGWSMTSVVIEEGVVTSLGSDRRGGETIDATGCLVGPGFVDMHAHLREPGQTWKEDVGTASAAAAAGGFTAITAMPNTDPPMDNVTVIESVLASAEEVDLVDIIPSGALTIGRAGETLVDIEGLHRRGVRIFSDDGDCVTDAAVVTGAMEAIARLPGALLAQHAENHALTVGGHMHEGRVSRALGIGGLPAHAESEVVRRDLDLAARTGAHYHCQHVSAGDTVELIRTAKADGVNVTAEVTPHHLSFDESHVEGLDTDFKMYPPLRTAADRQALVDALRDGTIDVVATDHAPHLPAEKNVPFSDAPRGVIGLETAGSAVWEALGDRDRFFATMSITPARLLGLSQHGQPIREGSPANLVVFDPDGKWVPGDFESKSSNSPYRGRVMIGRVMATIRRGELNHRSGVEVS